MWKSEDHFWKLLPSLPQWALWTKFRLPGLLIASAPALNLLEAGWKSILRRYGSTGVHSLVPRQQPHLRSQTHRTQI